MSKFGRSEHPAAHRGLCAGAGGRAAASAHGHGYWAEYCDDERLRADAIAAPTASKTRSR
ncbi:MAG: hypothetical protein R3A10_02000 [Caldilineaceae bacterium]